MTLNSSVSGQDTMDDLLATAMRNTSNNGDIAIATSRIIATRMALGMTAVLDPARTDHAEFARMVPEKVEAFSTAGLVMLWHMSYVNRHLVGVGLAEISTVARGTAEMTDCDGPVALGEAQGRFVCAWFDRIASSFIAIGMLGLNAQAAVMAPVGRTVAANSERLGWQHA